jgi:hypothetical protein
MPLPPPAAAAALLDAFDGLSRGLNHALSNRVNTLNTLLAVLQETPERDPEIDGALLAEEARFEGVLHLYRLMPLEGAAAPEPMVLADPVKDAVALLSHHLDLRMLACRVTGLEGAPPVRSLRQSLTQSILLMLVSVGRSVTGDDEGRGLSLVVSSTADEVFLRASSNRSAPSVDDSAWTAFAWLSSTIGATASRGVGDDGHPWAMMAMSTLAAERKKGR